MKLINSNCIEAMNAMPDNSVDSIVTDPPYELGFMGKSWDSTGIANSVEMWSQALRVLKPGGHLIAFSGSRTYHRMAVAIEDAGFEIRDQIMWVYGSGFPKSHNVSKGIDKAAGAERTEVIGTRSRNVKPFDDENGWNENNTTGNYNYTAPATPAAKQWDGWGTALKPAHEPMVLARKPIVGTVVNNVLTYGVGGLNIDGSRVATDDSFGGGAKGASGFAAGYDADGWVAGSTLGRFPANFIHDGSDEVVALMGEPARFFYCAKASKKDRNEGLDGFEVKEKRYMATANGTGETSIGMDRFTTNPVANHHPTVKPTELMRYLVRLITPPQGTVLDPFMGSGSTGKACAYEGFDFIGIDQSAEYVEIARARIEFALLQEETKEMELPF